MASECEAWHCINTVQDVALNPDLRFYQFPRGRGEIRTLWELGLRSGHRHGYSAKTISYLCSDHFEPWCFGKNKMLIKEAVPTLFYIPTYEEELNREEGRNETFTKRRLRKIMLEQFIFNPMRTNGKSLSYFVLPQKFAQPLRSKGNYVKPRPERFKTAKKTETKAKEPVSDPLEVSGLEREVKYKNYLEMSEEDFGEYRDEDILSPKCQALEEDPAKLPGPKTYEVPKSCQLKECSIIMEPLEDLARRIRGVYTHEIKETESASEFDAVNVVLYEKVKPARKKAAPPAPKKMTTRKKTTILPPMPVLPGISTDHGYGRDPRFKGCNPNNDPYQLKYKLSESLEKVKNLQRLAKRSEDRARKAESRLKLAEDAIYEYEKREHTLSLLPMDTLESPVAKEMVLCMMKNAGNRFKQYSDSVKDFGKALHDLSPKAYNFARVVMSLPTVKVIKDHKMNDNTEISRLLTLSEEEDQPRKRKGFSPGNSLFINREAVFREGKTYPLIVTEEEYGEIVTQPVESSQYDDEACRETQEDPEEDSYETSLLINPPVELGQPGQQAQQPKVVRARAKRRRGYMDEDSEEEDEESEDDQRKRTVKRRATGGKRLPARIQTTQVIQAQPQAGTTQFVQQVATQGFEVVTTTGGQQWANPSTYYQMEHSAGGVHYVQTLPMQVDAQNAQYITTDLSKIIDMSGYH